MEDGLKVKDHVAFGVGKDFDAFIGLRGHVYLALIDHDGILKDFQETDNLVTTLGLKCVMAQLATTPGDAKPGWMEVGSGTGQNAADTKLDAVITGGSGNRTACSSLTSTNAVFTAVCTFAAGYGTGTITEIGLFNIVTADTTDLILYADSFTITKGALDSLVVTWTLTAS